MPSKVKISKDDILNIAFQIARKEGLDNVNVRIIAQKLNCSVQPIYYQFENMEKLKIELMKKIGEYFYQFLLTKLNDDMPEYKQTGMNYIQFAKQEPKLFQILFMTETNLSPEVFISSDEGNYKKYEKIIKSCTNLANEDLKGFHVKMWIFTHGVATLVASHTCELSDAQISELLTDEFQALMANQKQ